MGSKSLTEALSLHCETVVGATRRRQIDMAARVSIVNEHFYCVYDTYVQPIRPVVDYRTLYTGIEAQHMKLALPFTEVQNKVKELLWDRFVVGYELCDHFRVLQLPRNYIERDIADYFDMDDGTETPSLEELALEYTGMNIQDGFHNSVRKARAAMKIYKCFEEEWEEDSDEEESEPEPPRRNYYYDSSDSSDW